MKERKNFKSVSVTGKLIDKQLATAKEFCETFASKRASANENVSRWFDEIFVSYTLDSDTSKQLASESKTAFEIRKQQDAKAKLALLTNSMKETSDLNKILTSKNKLFSLVLDFMLCFYDAENTKHFAKVETIAFDKENLTSEQVSEYETKCIDTESTSAKYAKVETFVNDKQKTYFVKVDYLSSVERFFAGSVSKVVCRRQDFDTLSEQDVIFYESERASKNGQDIKTLTACDKLTAARLCKFVAFSLFPANKQKAKDLQDQRKQASRERKQASK